MAGLEDSLSEDDFNLGQNLSQSEETKETKGDRSTHSPTFNFQRVNDSKVLTENSLQGLSDLSNKSMDCLSDSLDDEKFSKLAQLQSPSYLQKEVTKECLKEIKSSSSSKPSEEKKNNEDASNCLSESPLLNIESKQVETISPVCTETSVLRLPKEKASFSGKLTMSTTSSEIPAAISLKEAPKVKPSFGKKRAVKQPTSADQEGEVSRPSCLPLNRPEVKKIPKSEVLLRKSEGKKQPKEKKPKKKMDKPNIAAKECTTVPKKAKYLPVKKKVTNSLKHQKKKESSVPLKSMTTSSITKEVSSTSASVISTSTAMSEEKMVKQIKLEVKEEISEDQRMCEIKSEGDMAITEIKSEEMVATHQIQSEENITTPEIKSEEAIPKKPIFLTKKIVALPNKKASASAVSKESCSANGTGGKNDNSQDQKPILRDEIPSCSSTSNTNTELSGSNKQSAKKAKRKAYSKEERQEILQKKKESKEAREKEKELKKIEKEWKKREREKIKLNKKEKQEELRAKREARKIEIEENKIKKELDNLKKCSIALNTCSSTSSEPEVSEAMSSKEQHDSNSKGEKEGLRRDEFTDASPAAESNPNCDSKNFCNNNQVTKTAMKLKKAPRKRASVQPSYEEVTSSDEPDAKRQKSEESNVEESELASCSGTSSEMESGIVMLDSPSSFSTDSSIPCNSSATVKRNPRVKTLTIDRVAGPVWVQCCNMWCQKWRQLKDQFDPLSVPSHWTCSDNTDTNHNDCSLPPEKWRSYESENCQFVESTYGPGSIVWAKLSTYPWWPGMVEADPDENCYYELGESNSVQPVKYHVVFFGSPVSRSWVSAKRIFPYTNMEDANATRKSRVASNYKQDLEKCKREASEAVIIPVQERLGRYGFLNRHKVMKILKSRSRSNANSSDSGDSLGDNRNSDTTNGSVTSKAEKKAAGKMKKNSKGRPDESMVKNDERRAKGEMDTWSRQEEGAMASVENDNLNSTEIKSQLRIEDKEE